jgi:hypothetical protein
MKAMNPPWRFMKSNCRRAGAVTVAREFKEAGLSELRDPYVEWYSNPANRLRRACRYAERNLAHLSAHKPPDRDEHPTAGFAP